jgi:hypothetical protein
MAHQVGFWYAERVHQAGTVFGEQFGRVVYVGFVAPPQAAMIVDHHLIMLGELRHLRDPPRRQADAGAGDQHERIALAVDFIIEIDVVDFDFPALDRLKIFQCSPNGLAVWRRPEFTVT